MAARMDMLRTSEAAIVASVALRDVNRVIDEGILPAGLFSVDKGRFVTPAGCAFIAFYFETARRLTSEERLRAINSIEPRLRKWQQADFKLAKEDCIYRQDFLTIDLGPFVKRTGRELKRLNAARELVVSTPDILGGTPVIRGTRVPAHDVAASVAAGHSLEDVLAAYPALDANKVALAKLYADANPLRGRPRAAMTLPEGATLRSDRTVARQKR